MIDNITLYCNKVLSGEIITGKWVKLACERHLNDLKKSELNDPNFPYYFDLEKANKYIDFFGLLNHSKGELANTPVKLEPWQQFRIGSVFGWLHKETKYRRFFEAYNQVARKNGKSTEASGVGIELMTIDGEMGAEIYSASTKKDQSRIIFDESVRMVKASPYISKYIDIFRSNMNMPTTASKFEPLSSDANSLDGLNIHGALIDELHAHKTRDVYDVVVTATGARRQPLIWIVTTAGFNTNGICYEKYEYGCKVLEGTIDDDTFFCYIAQPDEDDDPFNPITWYKANPNMNISLYESDLLKKSKQAKEVPTALNNFLVKHLNLWTNANESWMNMLKYRSCEKVNKDFNIDDLIGKECYCGIDLSTTTDLSSVTLEFKLDNGKYAIINHCFLPKDNIDEKIRIDKVDYRLMEQLGFITLTDGGTIDYDYILHYIKEKSKLYKIIEIDYDPYNATQFIQNCMNEGFICVEVRQNFLNMSESTKDIEKLVFDNNLITFNNPLLRFAFSNAVPRFDASGNVKLDKSKSTKRIDPVISTVTSHFRCMNSNGNGGNKMMVWNF